MQVTEIFGKNRAEARFLYYEIYYDHEKKEIISQIPPGCQRDGSFGFGEHLIPVDGMLFTWHFTTALSPKCVFAPKFHVKRLRNGLDLCDEFEGVQLKEAAETSLGSNSLAYMIRVERKTELSDEVEALVNSASIPIEKVKPHFSTLFL